MKRIKLFFAIFFIFSIIIQSCKCPCDTEEISEFICSPQEATITEFNASVTNPTYITKGAKIIGVRYEPVDAYSIHSFLFPDNLYKTGVLTNEKVYDYNIGVQKFVIVKIPLSTFGINIPFYIAFLDDYPDNENLSGDWLVESINLTTPPTNSTALIRFAGWIVNTNNNFTSESSNQFCSFLETSFNDARITTLRSGLTSFKENANFINYSSLVNDTTIFIINNNNQILGDFSTGTFTINTTNAWITSKAFELLNSNIGTINANIPTFLLALQTKLGTKGYANISVKIGDVFYYRAKNGRDFVVNITNISERINSPIKKRLTIMFNER